MPPYCPYRPHDRGWPVRLNLQGIDKTVGAESWLRGISLAPEPGAVTVLLGATQAGKTSLMRIMAGLDVPTRGKVEVDGQDVTGMPVRDRNVAMVYQQFINYPSMTVYDNIASPLKLRGDKNIAAQVQALADRLHIAQFLKRLPAELSGGQQQRVALARALAKGAPLMLLDEPLVNLDYKLREELRRELTELFSSGSTTVVYATTEPLEALQLGGHVAVLHEGRLLQQGRTLDVFNAPNCIEVARTFSDPPINLLPAQIGADGIAQAEGGLAIPLSDQQQAALAGQRSVTLGVRAHSLHLAPQSDSDLAIAAQVDLAEISGSETYVHARRGALALVAQLGGVHNLEIGSACTVYCQPASLFIFGGGGELLFAPAVKGG